MQKKVTVRPHISFTLLCCLFFPAAALYSAIEEHSTASIEPDLLKSPSELMLRFFSEEMSNNKAPKYETTILAAIELNKGTNKQSYWMELSLGETSESEMQNSIGTLYTSTGRQFVFHSSKSTLHSHLYGPIRKKRLSKTKDEQFEIEVNDDYLSLGLNHLHEFFEAAKRYRKQFPDGEPMAYTIRSTPFEDKEQLFPPEVLSIAQLSVASERAFVGAVPSLTEFFKIVTETDGLKDILIKLIPKSKLLGLLNPFSKKGIQFNYGSPVPYQIDGAPFKLGLDTIGVIPVTLSIGEEPLLNLLFYTTDPSYEWKACAGVVALSAQSASKPNDRCLIRTFPAALIQARIQDQDTTISEK